MVSFRWRRDIVGVDVARDSDRTDSLRSLLWRYVRDPFVEWSASGPTRTFALETRSVKSYSVSVQDLSDLLYSAVALIREFHLLLLNLLETLSDSDDQHGATQIRDLEVSTDPDPQNTFQKFPVLCFFNLT